MKTTRFISALMAVAITASPVLYSTANFTSTTSGNCHITAYAAKQTGWAYKDGYWYYYDAKGNMLKNKLKGIKGKTYYFDNKGRMLEGKWNAGRYFFPGSGVMVTGCAPAIEGTTISWCNFDESGKRIEYLGEPLLTRSVLKIYESTNKNSKVIGTIPYDELIFCTQSRKTSSPNRLWERVNYKGKYKGWVCTKDETKKEYCTNDKIRLMAKAKRLFT